MPESSTTPYGPVASIYDAFLTLTGFKRGIERFLDEVDLDLPPRASILDAGCGTGLLSFYLARRFPAARIVATDIDTRMLHELIRLSKEQKFSEERLSAARSDLAEPAVLRSLGHGRATTLPDGTFDAVMVSAALEHVPLNASVARLAKLLKPGGTFFNLGMRRGPAAATFGMLYHFRPYTLGELRSACERAGLENIQVLRLGADAFPANLSRVGIIAKKRTAE